MINGTITIFNARLRFVAHALPKPLVISFWINSASRVKIAIRASEAAVTAVVALAVVIVVTILVFRRLDVTNIASIVYLSLSKLSSGTNYSMMNK